MFGEDFGIFKYLIIEDFGILFGKSFEVQENIAIVHTSIDEFQKKFSSRIYQRYLLHAKDIRKDQDLVSLPIYMALFL